MVYLFGTGNNVSVIMHERYLTEKQRANASLVLENLPEPEEREGFYPEIYLNPETKEVSYKYRKIVAVSNETQAT